MADEKISGMGVWRDHFSWEVLSRWDVLGVLIPGFPVAIGVGMLSIDWFPHNLLISQLCFGAAAAILAVKFIAVSVQAKGQPRLSRALFAVIVCAVIVLLSSEVIVAIQAHKRKSEESQERAASFASIDEFISKKSETELRDTFDIRTVERDGFILAKLNLTPAAATQVDTDTIERDREGGQMSFFYRYGDTSKPNTFKAIHGKLGMLLLTRKCVQNMETLNQYASSAFIPKEVATALKDFAQTFSDNNEILIDTINETYSTNPKAIANSFECPKEDCIVLNNLYYSRFINLKQKADAVTNALRISEKGN